MTWEQILAQELGRAPTIAELSAFGDRIAAAWNSPDQYQADISERRNRNSGSWETDAERFGQ